MRSKKDRVIALGLATVFALACSADPTDSTKFDAFSKLTAKLTGVAGFTMRADAMAPTIMPGDTIIASELPYRNADPQPGDIIVFTYPANTSVAFVSRVVAVGETTIEVRGGLTLLDGHAIPEGYVPESEKRTPDALTFAAMHVPARNLFVMGDNRDHSQDSRYKGFVPRNLVIGKVISIRGPTHTGK